MREIRQSGSEGGGAEPNRLSLPLYVLARELLSPLAGLKKDRGRGSDPGLKPWAIIGGP
jgi:hypothetical protein